MSPGRDEREQHGLAEHQPEREIEVRELYRVDTEAVDQRRALPEHVVRSNDESGRMTRSTDECEMSRSCHRLTSSRPADRLPRKMRARPDSRSAVIGLRLWASRTNPLTRPEALFDLTHLSALEVSHLGRDHLDGRSHRRARVEVLSVTIAG